MVSKKEPEQKQGGMKRILAAIAIIATALFLLAAAAPAAAPESSMQPAATVSNYTPTPVMNTNVTWSTFSNGWNPLEYSNGSANLSLNTDMSSLYTNPISVNPTDIQSSFPPVFHSINLYNKTLWGRSGTGILTSIQTITNTSHSLTYKLNETDSGATSNTVSIQFPTGDLPSSNPAYDYITIAGNLTAYTGMNFNIVIDNSTDYTLLTATNGTPTALLQTTNTATSHSPAKTESFWISASLKEANLTLGNSNIGLGFQNSLPQSTLDETLSVTINNIAISTAPMTLGAEQGNGTQTTVQAVLGNAHLTSFAPNFQWSEITDNGYSVAVSQPIQNTTEQQTSINDGSYTEQATYQGIFELPTAPDLSYGTANISVPLTISGKQYEVANLNGASYLSQIQTHSNGTFSFATVNPNSQNSLVLEVKYTTSQWDASSSAPSFFSLAGIEYYWWVALLGFMGLIGLGSVAMSHFGGTEETLRVPKGKFGR